MISNRRNPNKIASKLAKLNKLTATSDLVEEGKIIYRGSKNVLVGAVPSSSQLHKNRNLIDIDATLKVSIRNNLSEICQRELRNRTISQNYQSEPWIRTISQIIRKYQSENVV